MLVTLKFCSGATGALVSPFHVAAQEGAEEVMVLLLDSLQKIEPEVERSGKIAKVLKDTLERGTNLLHIAVNSGHAKVVALVLDTLNTLPEFERLRVVNATMKNGRSSFPLAAEHQGGQILKLLLTALKAQPVTVWCCAVIKAINTPPKKTTD